MRKSDWRHGHKIDGNNINSVCDERPGAVPGFANLDDGLFVMTTNLHVYLDCGAYSNVDMICFTAAAMSFVYLSYIYKLRFGQ